MLPKVKKQESDMSARFIILEVHVQGMLKSNTCNCYTRLLTKLKKQESAHSGMVKCADMSDSCFFPFGSI